MLSRVIRTLSSRSITSMHSFSAYQRPPARRCHNDRRAHRTGSATRAKNWSCRAASEPAAAPGESESTDMVSGRSLRVALPTQSCRRCRTPALATALPLRPLRESHEAVNPTSGFPLLARLPVTSVIAPRNHGVGDAHRQNRAIPCANSLPRSEFAQDREERATWIARPDQNGTKCCSITDRQSRLLSNHGRK